MSMPPQRFLRPNQLEVGRVSDYVQVWEENNGTSTGGRLEEDGPTSTSGEEEDEHITSGGAIFLFVCCLCTT